MGGQAEIENLISQEAFERLEAELAEMEGPQRRRIVAAIKTARAFGDLKENAEYHAAKDEQGMLESRIRSLRYRLETAEITEPGAGTGAGIGSKVTFKIGEGAERTLALASSMEGVRLEQGFISTASPIGKALFGSKPDDRIEIETPRGKQVLTVLAVASA